MDITKRLSRESSTDRIMTSTGSLNPLHLFHQHQNNYCAASTAEAHRADAELLKQARRSARGL